MKLLLAALVAAFLWAAPAAAQYPCAERSGIIDDLATKYSEAPVAMGLVNNGGVIEVLATSDGTTWTIIITMPNGVSCILAAGESWEAIPAGPKGAAL